MNPIENFEALLSNIFGETIQFKNRILSNNCIGALNNDQYDVFNKNFKERLIRLKSKYQNDPATLAQIVTTAKILGQTTGYKWSGAYSELVALDYWTSFEDISTDFVIKEDTNTFYDSVAKRIGQQQIDLDLKIELSSKIFFSDVKSFIPLHDELTDTIIQRVKSKIENTIPFLIGVDNIYDVDFLRIKEDLQNEMNGNLITTLIETINNTERYASYQLISGEYIHFRLSYAGEKGALLTTFREINVYKLAKDYKYKVLDYYNKLIFDKPSIITLVINQWFNKELNSDDENFEITFLRSLARRVFIDLKNDEQDMSQYFSDFNSSNEMTISEISKLISGINFIIDKSIKKTGEELYRSYIFLNPNAKNLLKESDFDIINWGPTKYFTYIEDFQHDNY